MQQNILLIIMLVCIAGCRQQKVDKVAEGEKLMQLSRDWSTVASSGNIDSTMSFWDDEAVVMAPGQPALKGKDAIRKMLEGTSRLPGFRISWDPKSVSISESGDMAYMLEETKIVMNDSSGTPFTQFNKALTVWKKQKNGSWKNVVDMWNDDPDPVR